MKLSVSLTKTEVKHILYLINYLNDDADAAKSAARKLRKALEVAK